MLYCLLTGELPFEIANSSDPAFNRFTELGFVAIEESLKEVNPDAVGRI